MKTTWWLEVAVWLDEHIVCHHNHWFCVWIETVSAELNNLEDAPYMRDNLKKQSKWDWR